MNKRELAQLVSITIFIFGMIHFGLYSFKIGCVLTGVAFYVMLMSESVLLAKVQNEMTISLEALRKKQDIEVLDLLFYLRQSKLGNSPWSNIDAAKNHIAKLGLPAIITDSGGACLALNKAFTDTLGYDKSFIGSLCHGIHRSSIYGDYVQGIETRLKSGQRFMYSRMSMIDSKGIERNGTCALIFLPDMRTAVGIWLPDNMGILTKL